MKIKTTELQGTALDWAVAKCELGEAINEVDDPHFYSTDWAQGGPIIEREAISVAADTAGMLDSFVWFASVDDILVDADQAVGMRGPTPLVAAMRCYVASKLGDEVELPGELTKGKK